MVNTFFTDFVGFSENNNRNIIDEKTNLIVTIDSIRKDIEKVNIL